MHPDKLFQGRRGYPNSIFREGLALKAGYAQMNDWSRLAVDPRRCKKLEAENELHEHIYATDRGAKGARPVRNRRAHKASVGRIPRTTPFVLDKYLS